MSALSRRALLLAAAPVRVRAMAMAVVAVVALCPAGSALGAQSAPPAAPPASEECFAFAFGGWTPALDARAAGHSTAVRDAPAPQAPHGRDWAMRLEAGRDTTLMLFPAWWPAGVAVRFPRGIEAGRDTVRGTATALVADGRATAPKAAALLWRIPCGRG